MAIDATVLTTLKVALAAGTADNADMDAWLQSFADLNQLNSEVIAELNAAKLVADL